MFESEICFLDYYLIIRKLFIFKFYVIWDSKWLKILNWECYPKYEYSQYVLINIIRTLCYYTQKNFHSARSERYSRYVYLRILDGPSESRNHRII